MLRSVRAIRFIMMQIVKFFIFKFYLEILIIISNYILLFYYYIVNFILLLNFFIFYFLLVVVINKIKKFRL